MRASRSAASILAPGVGGREASRLVGVISHRILEGWDFARPPDDLLMRIGPSLERFLPQELNEVRSKVADSLTEIFTIFGASESYARLSSAAILGREVPFRHALGRTAGHGRSHRRDLPP